MISIRWLIDSVLKTRGLEIREYSGHARRHAASMSLLVKAGFRPGTVVAVGVATGTPWLYEPFPGAQLVLIDPNPAYKDDLLRLKARYGAHVYSYAAGARAGEVTLHLDSVSPSGSSLLLVSSVLKDRWARDGVVHEFSEVRVPMRTLDETLAVVKYRPPFLIKIDTEGYERDVLLDATETLKEAEVVIAETSVMRRFEGSCEFADLIGLLDQRGFRLYDFLEVTTFGRGGPINYLDAVFVRRGSELLET